jgi:hypothetical protein
MHSSPIDKHLPRFCISACPLLGLLGIRMGCHMANIIERRMRAALSLIDVIEGSRFRPGGRFTHPGQAETLILTGITANIRVLFTANDAYMRDYRLFVPSDCVAASTAQDTDHSPRQMKMIPRPTSGRMPRLIWRASNRDARETRAES